MPSCDWRPGMAAMGHAGHMLTDVPTEVIFIGGRAGVGKSSVAAEASRILARADIRHACIEGDNLDQAHPEPWRNGIDLAEQNLTAMWRNTAPSATRV